MPFLAFPSIPSVLTVVPPEVATVHDLQCEQLTQCWPHPHCSVVSLATPLLLCCQWTSRRNLIKRLVPRLQLRYSPLSEYGWLATTWLQQQDPIFGPVLAAWPAKPSNVKEPSTHHTGIGAAVPWTVPWKMGSSMVGRLTSVVVNKWVSWCFTPCHPVRLHQGDSVVVFPSSWFCPAHFGLMSWRSFMIVWATKVISAPWSFWGLLSIGPPCTERSGTTSAAVSDALWAMHQCSTPL